MRWLKFVYEQYLKDIQEYEKDYKLGVKKYADIANKEKEIFNRFTEKLKETKTSLPKPKKDPKIGEIYLLKNIYFVIAETESYPYEVYICSPFWELATDKDIIAQGIEQTWVIENIVRYVNDKQIRKSFKFDEVSEKDVKIMHQFIHEGKPLPVEKVGLNVESKKSYQNLFKQNEIKRSLILLPILEENEEIAEIIKVTAPFFSKEELPLAADSFEEFDTMDHINLIKDKYKVILEFDEEYAGSLAEVLLKDKKIFEGFLPKQLEIKTDLYPAQIKELLNIKFL